MTEETIKIPEGHQVRVHSVAAEPAVLSTESGVLLVHLGFPGDDPKELPELLQLVKERTKGPLPHALFLEKPAKLSDLFAPNPISAHEHAVVIWTMPADASSSERLSQAAAQMRALEMLGVHQWLIFGGAPSVSEEALAPVKALSVPILVSSLEKHFLVEVRRPDEKIVVGMSNLTRWQKPDTIRENKNPSLFRAPLLRRLLLEASEKKTDEAWRTLYQELTERKYPLLFFVEPGGGLKLMSWKQSAEYLPLFLDLRSLLQTAAALQKEVGPHGVGALSTAALFSFAQKNKLRLAFSVFLDDGQVRYVIIPEAAYQALGEGRVP